MNILLVPEGIRKGRTINLSHRQLIVIAVTVVLYLPAFFTILGTAIYNELSRYSGIVQVSEIREQLSEIKELHSKLNATRDNTETHLNALAQRMGRMQAQLLRLDALGSRLTKMAGLDTKEFDFSIAPAVGGPEPPPGTRTNNHTDITEELAQLGKTLDTKIEQLTALEALMLDRQLTAAVTPAGWPAEGGWVSSRYGMRSDPFTGHRAFHDGVDIAARLNSDIYSIGEGVVSYAGPKSGYGLMVEVTHGKGYTTRYAHASETVAKVGDRVKRGQLLAKVGSSGRSTGPHLHVEVRKNGVSVNPESYLANKN